jgi:hypothetical protein
MVKQFVVYFYRHIRQAGSWSWAGAAAVLEHHILVNTN